MYHGERERKLHTQVNATHLSLSNAVLRLNPPEKNSK